MIFLKPMSAETFESFKRDSQAAYATNLSSVEDIPLEVALKSASEQFDKLVPNLYGYKCKVIALDDLIKIKKFMNRDKDKETLRQLLQIKNLKKN